MSKSVSDAKILQVKTLQYNVVVLPKLDNEEEIQELREKYDPWFYQIRPYVPMVLPFAPATLDEMQNVGDYISQARRKLHPVAISFHQCVESGDRLLFVIENGREELLELHHSLLGCEAAVLVEEAGYEPLLVVGRVPDPGHRAQALHEANRIGRTLGIVDAVSLIRTEPSEELKLVANYPFGIGRVDYYDRFLA